ncbi:Uncharacterised protein [Mycobacteroides abscessus subsp. massiliense]|nr:Uncharacterised protein [Mycobacteroides abscessus subsp. massiliense]
MQVPGSLCEIQRGCHGDKAPKIVYIEALETHGHIISGGLPIGCTIVSLRAIRHA